jgi:small GTP-binding protein
MNMNFRILLLGLQKVGKSSIIKRLSKSEFDQHIKPTLGTQIFKTVLQNTDFQIFDMGGHKKIRSNWYSPTLHPDGIIYVIDCAGDQQYLSEARAEFNNVVNYYYKSVERSVQKKPPLLILGNKIDLILGNKVDLVMDKKVDLYLLKEVIYEIPEGITLDMKYCSALSGYGIENAFKWIVGEILKQS